MTKTENNSEILKVNFDTQTVSARDLYEKLTFGKGQIYITEKLRKEFKAA